VPNPVLNLGKDNTIVCNPFPDFREEGFFMDIMTKDLRKDCLNKGILYGFVPHPLSIQDRPELDAFSFNVLFMRFKVENGKTISGTSLYEPDLDSYIKEDTVATLEYHNKYGGNSWLTIRYDESEKSYYGKKFVNGVNVGEAFGKEWKMFFLHFTILGLSEGERCKFEELPSKKSN
jgi:hypothetical protein